MTEFYSLIEEYLGDADAMSDVRVAVRHLWFYDFDGAPLRLWQGFGKLITDDDLEWYGTMNGAGGDIHSTPSLQDGRDGTSATYNFGLQIPDLPGEPARQTYDAVRTEQWRTKGRSLTCYLAIFQEGEGLRPQTPYVFYKELTMFDPKFSEKIEADGSGRLINKYNIGITAKDANFGRSNIPKGSYADSVQKRRAAELGVALDRGSEFLAALANRTYTVP